MTIPFMNIQQVKILLNLMDTGEAKALLNRVGTGLGCGVCLRCGDSNGWKRFHVTNYGRCGRGCLPLCEECWRELGRVARLPFYRKLLDMWQAPDDSELWLDVAAGVLAEEGNGHSHDSTE